MADGPGGERTERATPRRRQKALEKGQVALSQEVNSALVLLAGFGVLIAGIGFMGRTLGANSRYLFAQGYIFALDDPGTLREIALANLEVMLTALAPVLLGVMVVALAANLLQVGWHINPQALAFRWENINPANGLKQVFSRQALFELAKNLVKIVLISLLAWWTIHALGPRLMSISLLPVDGAARAGWRAVAALVFRLVAFMAVLAALDWAWQRWRYEESLKMTLQEVKEENKDVEGDPQIKARIRALQLEAARKRMLAEVPRADVVVTNPTHFAVALKYDQQRSAAPRVVARGADLVAQEIRSIALQANVPVFEAPPLARALYWNTRLGQEIPAELYLAVAQVLAYIYQLREFRRGGAYPQPPTHLEVPPEMQRPPQADPDGEGDPA